MQWFVCRGEGYEREPVASEADLCRLAPSVPIFGAEANGRYVVYDRILAREGYGPYRVVNMRDFTMELRAS
jgi:hypothetical protein